MWLKIAEQTSKVLKEIADEHFVKIRKPSVFCRALLYNGLVSTGK